MASFSEEEITAAEAEMFRALVKSISSGEVTLTMRNGRVIDGSELNKWIQYITNEENDD